MCPATDRVEDAVNVEAAGVEPVRCAGEGGCIVIRLLTAPLAAATAATAAAAAVAEAPTGPETELRVRGVFALVTLPPFDLVAKEDEKELGRASRLEGEAVMGREESRGVETARGVEPGEE